MILPRVAAGDPAALDDCIAQYGRLVWSLARRFSASHDDAEDAVQEVYLDLWQNAGRFDPSRGTEINFVGMLARRRLIDRYRKRQRNAEFTTISESIEVASPEQVDLVELAEEAGRARRSLERLRPQERQVAEMVAEGMTHNEIAVATRLPLGTVKTHARRGLAKLRRMLGVSADSAPADESEPPAETNSPAGGALHEPPLRTHPQGPP